MELVLRRRPSTDKCTIGDLYADGNLFCYVLEDVVRERPGLRVSEYKIPGETAIPQGRYPITITWSQRFKRELPLLNGVQGFEGVRIHPGNTSADTEGCILPGMSVAVDENAVHESRFAFNKLYTLIDMALEKGEEVHIDVRNP